MTKIIYYYIKLIIMTKLNILKNIENRIISHKQFNLTKQLI